MISFQFGFGKPKLIHAVKKQMDIIAQTEDNRDANDSAIEDIPEVIILNHLDIILYLNFCLYDVLFQEVIQVSAASSAVLPITIQKTVPSTLLGNMPSATDLVGSSGEHVSNPPVSNPNLHLPGPSTASSAGSLNQPRAGEGGDTEMQSKPSTRQRRKKAVPQSSSSGSLVSTIASQVTPLVPQTSSSLASQASSFFPHHASSDVSSQGSLGSTSAPGPCSGLALQSDSGLTDQLDLHTSSISAPQVNPSFPPKASLVNPEQASLADHQKVSHPQDIALLRYLVPKVSSTLASQASSYFPRQGSPSSVLTPLPSFPSVEQALVTQASHALDPQPSSAPKDSLAFSGQASFDNFALRCDPNATLKKRQLLDRAPSSAPQPSLAFPGQASSVIPALCDASSSFDPNATLEKKRLQERAYSANQIFENAKSLEAHSAQGATKYHSVDLERTERLKQQKQTDLRHQQMRDEFETLRMYSKQVEQRKLQMRNDQLADDENPAVVEQPVTSTLKRYGLVKYKEQ